MICLYVWGQLELNDAHTCIYVHRIFLILVAGRSLSVVLLHVRNTAMMSRTVEMSLLKNRWDFQSPNLSYLYTKTINLLIFIVLRCRNFFSIQFRQKYFIFDT